MKKIIKGFTLIEILVVISIIAIMSSVSINSFFNLTKNNNTKNKLLEISSDIKSLDLKVKNYEIFDYEIIFDTNNINSYIIYENIFDEEKSQKITSLSNDIFTITLNGLSGELWKYQIYQDIKLIINNYTSTGILNINRDSNYNYQINGQLELLGNEIFLNNIELKNFDNNNLDLNIEKITQDEYSEDIGYIKITNIGGKKQFLNIDDDILNIDQFYLHFEEGGRENYLIIDKK